MRRTIFGGSRRHFAAITLAGALLGTFGPAAPAMAAGQIVCNAAGVVTIIPNPPGPGANQWTIVAKGSCMGDNQGTYMADVTAVGGSDTLGGCDGDGENPIMQDLSLSVTVTLTSTATGATKVLSETWSAPITTFPTATPFLISDGGLMSENDFVGGGNIFTRLYRNCPPGGVPAGQITWARDL
ncbi:MAG: hypothetical protein WEB06_21000 [Actinomycetota bacterium]